MAKIQLDPEELDHLLGTPSGPSILPNGPGPVPMAPLTRKPLANQPVPSITGMNLGAPPAPPRSITDNPLGPMNPATPDRKSTRLNSSHSSISYAVFCLKKKNKK